MKKVSTVVARQSGNCSRQTLTIGLDLGDRNSYYCVVNEVGELEQKITTTAKAASGKKRKDIQMFYPQELLPCSN